MGILLRLILRISKEKNGMRHLLVGPKDILHYVQRIVFGHALGNGHLHILGCMNNNIVNRQKFIKVFISYKTLVTRMS